MLKFLKYLIIFTCLSIVFGCSKKEEKIQPSLEKISESVYASGNIKSKNQYQVFSTVAGLIQKILVKEGDIVHKGDALFVIQNEASKLNEENAKLSSDFAEWNTRGEKLNDLQATIESARNKMINDSLNFQRQSALWNQQIGSKMQLEQAELAAITSKNNYQSAIFRYKDLKKQLNLTAEQSKKQLSISKSLAKDYIVRSQVDGKVFNISREVGETVSSQIPLAIIGSAENFYAELQIDENDIVRLRLGQKTLLSMESYKNQIFEATISVINPIMNERTRTFTIEAEFVQKPKVLYPNLTTEANIVMETKDKALTIPRMYLVDDSLVMLPNKEKRRVKTGLKDYLKVEILEGLNANDFIVKPTK